jgi:hypothetical protein
MASGERELRFHVGMNFTMVGDALSINCGNGFVLRFSSGINAYHVYSEKIWVCDKLFWISRNELIPKPLAPLA